MSDTKLNGCCTMCDNSVFDINTLNPDGSPCDIGAALENAMRATLVLTDGSTCDLTFCEDCVPEIEENLPAIWAKCMRSNAGEPASDAGRAATVRLTAIVPLGLIAVRRWRDILKEERPLRWKT